MTSNNHTTSAITYDVEVDGRGAKLSCTDKILRYESASQEIVETLYEIRPIAARDYSVLIGSRSFAVTIATSGEVFVDGRLYRVDITDPRSLRGRKSAIQAGGRKNIVSPMPGRVVRVLTEAGDTVTAGQGLVVVEAMKMQNEIKAPVDGRIVQINCTAGATVVVGAVLLVLE